MKPQSKKLTCIAVLGLIALGATTASATLISIGDHLSLSGTVDTTKADTGYVSYNGGAAEHVYSGVFALTVVNHSQLDNTFGIQTFCTDVGVNWQSGQPYTAVQFGGQTGINPSWSA